MVTHLHCQWALKWCHCATSQWCYKWCHQVKQPHTLWCNGYKSAIYLYNCINDKKCIHKHHIQWNLSTKDLWNKDISLTRTLPVVPVTQISVQNNLWNKDTSLFRTLHVVPVVSVIERFHCISQLEYRCQLSLGPKTIIESWIHVYLFLFICECLKFQSVQNTRS